MAIILRVFDGKEQPQLPLGLTINSALQYLTTFTKVAFVVPIIEGLGQLKWLWFASGPPRPLLDFELYEEATRGGLIAIFKLFLRLRGVFRWYFTLSYFTRSSLAPLALCYADTIFVGKAASVAGQRASRLGPLHIRRHATGGQLRVAAPAFRQPGSQGRASVGIFEVEWERVSASFVAFFLPDSR
jgi:hypothetical protein